MTPPLPRRAPGGLLFASAGSLPAPANCLTRPDSPRGNPKTLGPATARPPAREPQGPHRTGRFTPAEDDFLREYYTTKGRDWCAHELNRSYDSIKNRVRRIGLTRKREAAPKRARSDREITFSRQNLMPVDVTELGKVREYPRAIPLGEPCSKHPGNTIGAWGKCPACEAGQRWATRQRQTVIRPHHEGGR